LWLCEKGHINEVLEENPKSLIEYDFVLRLFHDAGFGVLPVRVKQKEEPEEKGVDQFL